VSAGRRGKNWVDDLEHRQAAGGRVCRVQKGKELNDFQRNLLDIEILSNLRFGSLEIRETSVSRVMSSAEGKKELNDFQRNLLDM
jgi:hypothetical protein